MNQVIRSKGFFWIATRSDFVFNWSQAGSSFTVGPYGKWYSAVPKDQWPTDVALKDQITLDWDSTYGDRKNEIVFIGQNLEKEKIANLLNEALLSDEEYQLAKESKLIFKDEFPGSPS